MMTDTWYLEGYDAFEGMAYPLGIQGRTGKRRGYPTYNHALSAAHARLESLEGSQPTVSSGGQFPGGIQDRVYIIHPDGRRERVYPEDYPHDPAQELTDLVEEFGSLLLQQIDSLQEQIHSLQEKAAARRREIPGKEQAAGD